jgi:hypothetical protein
MKRIILTAFDFLKRLAWLRTLQLNLNSKPFSKQSQSKQLKIKIVNDELL